MNALVIYETQFGNTEQIAQAIAKAARRAPSGAP
jgi:flavodoxin